MVDHAGSRHSLPYDVNLSILFTELPLLERAEAARALGFKAVEYWWPFDVAVPSDTDVDRFVASIVEARLTLVGLNFFAGDMAAGERGIVSAPGREAEFADSVAIAVHIAERLGCRSFNALYGNRIDGVDASAQDEVALSNLDVAANAAARIGAGLVLEPLSGLESHPLKTAADAFAVIDKLGRDDVRLLADLYHLATNGDDLDAVIAEYTPRIGHVQIADVPGRNQPGTGSLDLEGYLEKLQNAGYAGHVGIEYKPLGGSVESFGWLPQTRRGQR
jgi:hydroxypyruvate isomerase